MLCKNLIFNDNWTRGNGKRVPYIKMIEDIKDQLSLGSKLFIGTDSFVTNNKVVFASALCIHGVEKGSFYFFVREKTEKKKYEALISRITEEVRRTVELADHFNNQIGLEPHQLELHIDVSPIGAKKATSKFSDMLKGYVAGAGYECKIKPYAWASQSVADRHSK